jgi:CRP-like cAMP-binding protein
VIDTPVISVAIDDSKQIARVLRTHPAIAALPEAAQMRIASTATLTKHARRGVLMIPKSCFAIVGFGLVKSAFVVEPRHVEFVIGLAGPGESIDMPNVLRVGDAVASVASLETTASRRPAQHVVLTESATMVYAKTVAALTELSADPRAAFALAIECNRLQERMTSRLLWSLHSSAEIRVALVLADLQERYGDDREDGSAFIPLRLTRAELAAMAGVSTETAIRVLSAWAKIGLVTDADNGGTEIRNRDEFRRIVGEP